MKVKDIRLSVKKKIGPYWYVKKQIKHQYVHYHYDLFSDTSCIKKEGGSRTTCSAGDDTETLKDWECTATNWTKWEANTQKAQLSLEQKGIVVRGCLTILFVERVIKIKIIRLSKESRFTRKGKVTWKNRDGAFYLNWQITFIIQTL